MSTRRLRRLLLLAICSGAAWWAYRTRPTFSGVVDQLTRPLLGSKVAVKESERNRVVSEASAVVHTQSESPVGAIRENMTYREVRQLLGEPEKVETLQKDGRVRVRWLYQRVHRAVVFEDGRAVSISIL